MQQTILAIAGKPGLYKLVSRGNNNLIVEALDATHKRMPAFATDRITSLADIAMFTETDDVPLMDVLENLKTLENGKKASINEKKASGDELRAYFTKVLPEWDQERVHNSDIKKLITWYNILVEAGITDGIMINKACCKTKKGQHHSEENLRASDIASCRSFQCNGCSARRPVPFQIPC